ncbi:MAG: MFS transporter [Bacteroidales bacterium]|nr:MFS transporter [Bacteroidales bacterium]
MNLKPVNTKKSDALWWAALACLVVPMFASYFFDDMFSTVSHIFGRPEALELGWDARDFGNFIGDYSLLCVCGGLIIGGILLDIFGVRVMGSVFLAMMVGGGVMIYLGVASGLPKESAIVLGRIGRMFFGLGSEIAGVAVTRSTAKWFKGRNMSFAMGLQLAIARAGTATALIAAPLIVGIPKDFYSLKDTARPALIGLFLLLAGAVVWAIFVALDAGFDRREGIVSARGEVQDEDKFRFKDIAGLLRNPRFLMIGILCVTFYCCVSSFKKFGTAVVIPRFGIDPAIAGTMVSMIPFFTIIFTPLFGALVDRTGHATRWMAGGSIAVLAGHMLIAFAPQGAQLFGYAGIGLLGLGYSLVPSAMWPSVPRIVPERNLGTAYSLIYWIQNIGLFFVPKAVGRILASDPGLNGAARTEHLFIGLALMAIAVASMLMHSSDAHPELHLDTARANENKTE